jgi:hypothetical protein
MSETRRPSPSEGPVGSKAAFYAVSYDINGCVEAFTGIEELLGREYGLFHLPSPQKAYNEGEDGPAA